MPRTRNDRSSVRRSGAVVESLSITGGIPIDGPVVLAGASFTAPNIFNVGGTPGVIGAPITVSDANFVATPANGVIVFIAPITANRTVTLPTLASTTNGFEYTVKDRTGIGGFFITVLAQAGEFIDGVSSFSIGTGNEGTVGFLKVSNTVGWIVI